LAFDALARHGSFTAAADALGCAKSRVSQLVKQLELELGAVLVLRNTRRVALTEAGQRLAVHARQLREMLDRVRGDVGNVQDCVEGPLVI
ncbi:LysR family transcriptional regulator, partial [Vibrio parahaemolyticus]